MGLTVSYAETAGKAAMLTAGRANGLGTEMWVKPENGQKMAKSLGKDLSG